MESDMPVLLSAPLLAMFTLELAKWIVRKWIVKDPEHDFPPVFYETLIPFFTGLWGYVLAVVGWGEPVGFDVMTLVQWAFASLITIMLYQFGLSPLKTYGRKYREDRQ